jgi:hypothetical protein
MKTSKTVEDRLAASLGVFIGRIFTHPVTDPGIFPNQKEMHDAMQALRDYDKSKKKK